MNRKFSLKKSHDIDKLVKLKQSVGNKFYAVYYDYTDKLPQVAISASKRFKTAVERNYEKRVIKEILRAKMILTENLKLLIVIKTTVRDLNYYQKTDQILYLLGKIKRRKDEK